MAGPARMVSVRAGTRPTPINTVFVGRVPQARSPSGSRPHRKGGRQPLPDSRGRREQRRVYHRQWRGARRYQEPEQRGADSRPDQDGHRQVDHSHHQHAHARRPQRQRHFGASHTNGDAIVVFRNLRVAHTGDMFATKGQPLIDRPNGGSVEYGATIGKAAAGIKNVDRVITGHSAVFPWQDFVMYGEVNRLVLDYSRQALKAGKTAEQASMKFMMPESSARPGIPMAAPAAAATSPSSSRNCRPRNREAARSGSDGSSSNASRLR